MRNLFKNYNVKNIKFEFKITHLLNLFSLLVSWYINKSILWGIVHYILGAYYLIYCIITRVFSDGEFVKMFNYYF